MSPFFYGFREFCEDCAESLAKYYGIIVAIVVAGFFTFASCRELSYQGARTVEANVEGQKNLIEYQLFLFQGAAAQKGGARDHDA